MVVRDVHQSSVGENPDHLLVWSERVTNNSLYGRPPSLRPAINVFKLAVFLVGVRAFPPLAEVAEFLYPHDVLNAVSLNENGSIRRNTVAINNFCAKLVHDDSASKLNPVSS